MIYEPRLTAPSTDDYHYYGNGNPFVSAGFGLPNCTCYAWARFWENLEKLGINEKPRLQTSNAENWFNDEKFYNKGQVPKLGAVAVWRQGAYHNDSDGAGHVSIVEQINEDGSIICSGSAYKGAVFRIENYNSNYEKPGFTFDGFIYLPKDFDNKTDESQDDSLQKELEDLKSENEELKAEIDNLKKQISYSFSYNVKKTAFHKVKLNKDEIVYIKKSR